MTAHRLADAAPAPDAPPIAPGTPAPAFNLHCAPDQAISLADLRGRPVILAFYPADWSPVCGDQMALYNEVREEFAEHRAQLLGVSVDSVWCHQAFSEARNLHFPLLADFEPKGEVARRYNAYRAEDGFCERSLFVIDADGVVRWSYTSPVGENPGADGILQALEALTAEQRGNGGVPDDVRHAAAPPANAPPGAPSDSLAASRGPRADTTGVRP